MPQYSAYPGGSLSKWPLDSIAHTGGTPTANGNTRHSGHLPRNMFALPFRFDGGSEWWQEMMLWNTPNQAGFAVGDEVVGAFTSNTVSHNGIAFHLKKNLPSGIGLTVTLESAAADLNPSLTDTFQTRTLTIPAGAKAGISFIAYSTDDKSFAPYGAHLKARFDGAAGMQAGQLLDVSQVCFEAIWTITDFGARDKCTNVQPPCDWQLGPSEDVDPINFPQNASAFKVPKEAVADAPSSTAGTTSGSSAKSAAGGPSTSADDSK